MFITFAICNRHVVQMLPKVGGDKRELTLQIKSGFRNYVRDPWNKMDQTMYLTLLLAFILRLTLAVDNFVVARYVYVINLVMFYLRILQLYYIHRRLGPTVVVIWRMVRSTLCATVTHCQRQCQFYRASVFSKTYSAHECYVVGQRANRNFSTRTSQRSSAV